jgi:hypothetical protein
MDRRRSFYLASRQDDFDPPVPDEADRVDFTDVPYVTPANDNFRVKGRLSIRCGTLLRRLIALHSLS